MTWISIAQVKTFTLQVLREYPLSPQGWTCPQEYWTVSMCQQFLSSFQRKWARVLAWSLFEKNMWVLPGWFVCMSLCVSLCFKTRTSKANIGEDERVEQEQLFELQRTQLFCWTADTTDMIHNFRVLNVSFRIWSAAILETSWGAADSNWLRSSIDSQGRKSFDQGLSRPKKPSKTETSFNYRMFGIFFANKPSLCSIGFHVVDIETKRMAYMAHIVVEDVEVLSSERGAEDKLSEGNNM